MPNRSNWLIHPQYQSKVDIPVANSLAEVRPILQTLDFSYSKILRFLFKLSGMRTADMNLAGLLKMNFCILEVDEPKKITLGVKGKFWRIRKVLLPITKVSFLKEVSGYTRLTWVFRLEEVNPDNCHLYFNLEIESPDKKTHRKMSIYWFFIRPISTWIRKEMLKAMVLKLKAAS